MRKTFLVMSRLIDLFVDILPIDELGFKHVNITKIVFIWL